MTDALRVLIVDDSRDDAELMVRALRQDGFLPVYARVETAEALAAALAHPAGWDVITCDSGVPRLDTAQVLAAVQLALPRVPVVLVSGRFRHELAHDLSDGLARAFVSKDHLDELPSTIKELLQRHSHTSNPPRVAVQDRFAQQAERTHRLRTNQGRLTDPEFEAVAVGYFHDPRLHDLPGPTQVDLLLTDHGIMLGQQDWARAVAQRALTKVILAS